MAQRTPIVIPAGNDQFPKYGDDVMNVGTQFAKLYADYANRYFGQAAETEAKRQQQERAMEFENQQLDKKLANSMSIAKMRQSSVGATFTPGGSGLITPQMAGDAWRADPTNFFNNWKEVRDQKGRVIAYQRAGENAPSQSIDPTRQSTNGGVPAPAGPSPAVPIPAAGQAPPPPAPGPSVSTVRGIVLNPDGSIKK